MTQTVTLHIPDSLYEPIHRAAQATNQPLETVLLTALSSSLPTLDGLPTETQAELLSLEGLDNEALWKIMLEAVSADQQLTLESLLNRAATQPLTPAEQSQLESLQKQVDLTMLRKARAAVLLRFRGLRIPTLGELHQLSLAA